MQTTEKTLGVQAKRRGRSRGQGARRSPVNRRQETDPHATRARTRRRKKGGLLREIVRKMAVHLREGDATAAARLFTEAHQHEAFQDHPDVLRWLIRKLGKDQAGKLVDGLSHLPCYNCSKGYVSCEDCDGEGHLDYEKTCERCMGLGVVPCDFCAGSGLMGIEGLPLGLQSIVAIERLRRSLKRVKKHVECPLPQAEQDDAGRGAEECAKLLLALERRIRVLENMLALAGPLARSGRKVRKTLDEPISSCGKTAVAAETRIRECLQQLTAAAIHDAQRAAEGTPARQLAESKVTLYQKLLASEGLAGTGFDRAPLAATVKRATREAFPRRRQRKQRNA